MIHTLLIIVHIAICLVLSVVVLLQSSKGGGLAGAFGGAGGAPQQLLGSRGMTTLLHKITIYCAVGFFVTSFLLFMTDTSGEVRATNVVGEAARKGELTLPVEGDPLLENPLQAPTESGTETPVETQGGDTDAGNADEEQGGGQ